MPELPEVETTLNGIKPHILHHKITDVIVRHPRLRWPVPADLMQLLKGQILQEATRRSKYLLLRFKHGTLILHLGMSGRLRILKEELPPQKHDHVDIVFANDTVLRFTDPRRFGAVLWTENNIESHPLIKSIGPEPLSKTFNGDMLWQRARNKSAPVKSFIMDAHTVAGVGNIYATEALFMARIHPKKAAGKVTREQYQALARAIKTVLKNAIKKGGTTLKDFAQSDGKPGYFSIELNVYGHAGKPCPTCKTKLKNIKLGQRSTVYCQQCQK